MKKKLLVIFLLATLPRISWGDTIVSFDFNSANSWPAAATDVNPSTPIDVDTSIAQQPVGVIEKQATVERSGGLLLNCKVGKVALPWEASFASGLLSVKNRESDLRKLTLSFDLSVSSAHPVVLRFQSFDAARNLTGTLESAVVPAAPDFYQRNSIDLSTMKSVDGKFNPLDPYIQIVFVMTNPTWPDETTNQLRLDNIHYGSISIYVSPQGKDSNDGRSESTPLLDPQKAVEMAQSGDIIALMDGEYHRAEGSSIHKGIACFPHGGTPAAWIVLKNYPGQHPLLRSDAWGTITIGRGADGKHQNTDPALAYLEIRGLHIRGYGDTVRKDFPGKIGKVDPITNGNGISVDGGSEKNTPHHIRIADNLIEYCCGGGAGSGDADWMTVEGNTINNNCWTMIYAGSGISLLGTKNFDAESNVYKDLIRNNQLFGNRCYEPWESVKHMSDGNGIIIDSNYVPAKSQVYLGRTLIQNNLVVASGGSGIHSFKSHQVDIVNNTAYYNGSTPELKWGQIFVQRGDDFRFINNIAVARPGQPVNSVGLDVTDQGSTHVWRSNNLYLTGGVTYVKGNNDMEGDPLFVHASLDFKNADFRLKPASPALGKGIWVPFGPLLDLENKLRPASSAPDLGAYQH